MNARFQHALTFPVLATRLSPGARKRDLECDVENVFQWMYVNLPQFDASLNISRDHGWVAVPE